MSKHCNPGMKVKLLLHLIFQGFLLYETFAWEVRMPKEIHGLKGSCLVIPCSFSYTSYPPTNPNRVVWYQWVSEGYPLVYDPEHPSDVIDKFKGNTFLFGDPKKRECSLLIINLDQSHHGEKLYAWIDPESVRNSTYRFFDVTSTILVDTYPKPPTINIYGGERIGDDMIMACHTYHSCPYSKPKIILNGIERSNQTTTDHIEDGLWKITLTRRGVVKAESSDIECIVTHYGGIRARATKNKSSAYYETRMVDPEIKDTDRVYEADVVPRLTALPRSCVVIPCSFQMHEELAVHLWVRWVSKKVYMFHSGQSKVLDNFKGRTKLLGNSIDQDCTVEIDNVQNDDNGPFCFRAETENKKYLFNNSCVFIVMRAPDKPVMSPIPDNIEPGTNVTIECSVKHTCPSHPPSITWSVLTARETVKHQSMGEGVWETVSTVTFIPTGYEEESQIICNASFWGDKTVVNSSTKLSVQRFQRVRVEILGPSIIVPILVFLLLCIVYILYKRRRSQRKKSIKDYENYCTNMADLNIYGNIG
ncbi:uncharacterized protein LOC130429093 [Triplophysa dalaica]|uniref:uncharacterized protein LOC130429093 n=1 Tax=Triplophysa dalaica TaxID=1582913 RepID=UPI0024DF6AE2|nr:uncharacterized protein LOC130429093 [Triplophysa dalaica]